MTKALKKLTVLVCIFAMSFAGAAAEKVPKASPAQPAVKTPASFSEAVKAYDEGEFALAADYFRKHIRKNAPDPALLYNLGSCLCSQGDFAGALVCFERARLLAPDDTATLENLNFIRRQLLLPAVCQIETPTEMLIAGCYSLRPDQWLLAALLAWTAAGIFMAFRRRLSRNKLIIFVGSCAIIMVLAIAACIFERTDNYSNRRAVVTSADAELRSLPSMVSGSKLGRLRLGTMVKIAESRFNWIRIKNDNARGWLKADMITRVAPGNPLPPGNGKDVPKLKIPLKK